jgi:hypothetical protein
MSDNPLPPPTGSPVVSANTGVKTPGTVTAGFVLSLLGFFFITAIIGVILGLVGLSAAKRVGKGVGLAWAAIVIGAAWILLFVAIAVVSGGSDDDSPASEPVATQQQDVEDEPVVEELADEELAAEEPAVEEAEPEPVVEPTVEPLEFSGSGNKILQFDSGPFVATIAHGGNRNFVVWGMDSGLNDTDLLVNTIGDYQGRVLGSDDSYGGLKIEGDGNWTVQVVPVSQAPRLSGSVQGTGDDVFIWDGSRTVASINHNGSRNFVVWLFSSSGTDLLINDIGPFSGESVIEDGVFEINADGNWSITPQ